jgi:hypothetical protein
MDRPDATSNDRRAFIQELAAMFAAAGAGLSWPGAAQAAPDTRVTGQTPSRAMVGMQVGPHTMLDEGIDRSLDLIQKTAAVNTIFVYSHAYGGDLRKAPNLLATDHGVVPRDQRTRNLPLVWVKQHDQYFRDTTLRHPVVDQTFDHHERDLFAEMMKPLRARGHEGVRAHPRSRSTRHHQLLQSRRRQRVRQADPDGLLESSGIHRILARDGRGSLQELRARRLPVGR